MSHPSKPEPVLFFTGLLYDAKMDLIEILDSLRDVYGKIDIFMDPVDFIWTDYYKLEMGGNLKRTWVSFDELIMPDELAAQKHRAYELERQYAAKDFQRRLNIDPGILTPAKLILATYKDFSHRIYLGDGVFAEITLLFSGGDFRSLEWTFTDYRNSSNQTFFHLMRKSLKQKLTAIKSSKKQ